MNEGPAEKHITREEGERNSLHPVFPMVSGCIEGQESFKPFPRQDSMNTLLMLMASVKSVPAIAGVVVSYQCLAIGHGSNTSAA
jgi:hypothetical protein